MVLKPASRSIRIGRPRLKFQKMDRIGYTAVSASSTKLATTSPEPKVLLASISACVDADILRTSHFAVGCTGQSNSRIRSRMHLVNQPCLNGQADSQPCCA